MFVARPFMHNFAQVDLFEKSVFLHRKRQRTVLISEIRLAGRFDNVLNLKGRMTAIQATP